MAIPDGWDEVQQGVLKKGLVAARKRLSTTRSDPQRPAIGSSPARSSFTLADLGGSTVDVCMYRCVQVSPTLQIKEVKSSDYKEKPKRKVCGADETFYIKFASPSASDEDHGVIKGRLVLSRAKVKSTFSVCVNEVVASIKHQVRMGNDQSLQTRLSKLAVAEGAIYLHLSSLVRARATRTSYRIEVIHRYTPSNRNCRNRFSFRHISGLDYVYGAWSTIVAKGSVLHTSATFSQPYIRASLDLSALGEFESEVLVYEGDELNPKWCRDRYGNLSSFSGLFTPL
ncbi:hypothetical protein BCR35DRAFT_314752 [Leucosporidium creatinivorum]|uniref:Uncharacterized protein n=1 Tax=Leucosporidium creatinivorum TaxID=106004 RepID=A0A1Y2ET80_9BASI|nr:hypothetical protein BCR35DRAFT_314752 [Leucosporidium creatinivorum]